MLNWPANFSEASLLLTWNFFISACHWCLAGYNFSFSQLAGAHSSRDYGDSGGEFLQRNFFPFHSIISGYKHKLSLWGGLPSRYIRITVKKDPLSTPIVGTVLVLFGTHELTTVWMDSCTTTACLAHSYMMWPNCTAILQLIYSKIFYNFTELVLSLEVTTFFFFWSHWSLPTKGEYSPLMTKYVWLCITFPLSHHSFAADLMHKSCNKQLLPMIHSGKHFLFLKCLRFGVCFGLLGFFFYFPFFPNIFCSQGKCPEYKYLTEHKTDPNMQFHLNYSVSGDEPKHPFARHLSLTKNTCLSRQAWCRNCTWYAVNICRAFLIIKKRFFYYYYSS